MPLSCSPTSRSSSMAKVIKAFPPNFTSLTKAFPQIKGRAGQGIIFAYGDRIYNPSGRPLGQHILAHENEHCQRQNAQGVGSWWDAYMVNPQFRLAEEVLAHRIEWDTYQKYVTRLADQEDYLKTMVERLSGPLYGYLVTKAEAFNLITSYNAGNTSKA